MSIAPSEEEMQVDEEKNVDGATIATNNQERKEAGEGSGGNLDDANEDAREDEEEEPKEEEEEEEGENNQVADGFGGNLDVDIRMEKKNGAKDARVDQRRRYLENLRCNKVDIDTEINLLKAIDSPFGNSESTMKSENLHGFSDERIPRKETMWRINDSPSNLEAFALEDNLKLPDLEKDQYWSSILFGDQKVDTLYLVGSSTVSNDLPSTSGAVGFAMNDLPSLDEAFWDDDLE